MESSVYNGLKLLPAVLVLLDVDEDPVARQAVRVVPVQRSGTPPWTEDEVTIDWERLQDPRRSSTTEAAGRGSEGVPRFGASAGPR